ncbi:hypothetical protein [Paenibacillus chungangensis]|uniref:Uncharacterized protein n=1 Tax=Paenibacillus chungangensis TaxID=696535 RepID=A0ABW3HKL6_9BACL
MSDSTKNESGVMKRLVAHDAEVIQPLRKEKLDRLDRVKASSVEAQLAFIKELVKNQESTKAFLKDPKKYAVDHGILLSPEVVKAISNAVIFDVALDEEVANTLGSHGLQDLIDMREGKPTGVHANAAAVAAGAAVVAAAAAVVTMVVTLVRASQPADLVSLQGLGKQGIKLPGGKNFIPRDNMKTNFNLRGRGF